MPTIRGLTTESIAIRAIRSKMGLFGAFAALVNSVALLMIPTRLDMVTSGGVEFREILLTVTIALIVIVAGAATTYFSTRVGNSVAFELRELTIDSQSKSQRVSNPDLAVQLLSNDIDRLSGFAAGNALKFPSYVLTLLVVIPAMVIFKSWVVLALIVFVLLALLAVKPGYRRLSLLQKGETEARKELVRQFDIYNRNVQMLRANRTDDELIASIEAQSHEVLEHKNRIAFTKALISPVNQSLGTVLAVLYVLGSLIAINLGLATVAETVKASIYLAILVPALVGISNYFAERPNNMVTANYLQDIVSSNQVPVIKISGFGQKISSKIPEELSPGEIQFKNGETLRYPAMDFHHGVPNAIQGRTGCGKSSLLLLLSGVYRSTDSSLQDDFTNESESRRRLVFLPQSSQVPTSDLEECIKLIVGSGRIDRQAFAENLRRLSVNQSEFEHIEDRDLKSFSGGQQQRIMLAIAISTPSSSFIFDEPTSSLDRETASWVVEQLSDIARETPMIFSTHGDTTPETVIHKLGE